MFALYGCGEARDYIDVYAIYRSQAAGLALDPSQQPDTGPDL